MSEPGNPKHATSKASTTGGLPVAVSLGPVLDSANIRVQTALVDGRVFFLCVVATLIGFATSFVSKWLLDLIDFFTNLSFYGRLSFTHVSPTGHHLGWVVILVPVIGGAIIGLMSRYGAKGVLGDGIPEAMEQVLVNRSRIPPLLLFLKPLSAALSIGTGGPFGAEGPIIATGGAVGSVVGQFLKTTASERKTLLAAGAAAGIAAIFGTPVAAVLLAVEILLFEFRPRSLIPVALASVTAMGMHIVLFGAGPVFPMPDLAQPGGAALFSYILIGALIGAAAAGITALVHAIEDWFEHLPIHWMWGPALGAVAVGVIGFYEPRTFGVGYDNIDNILSGHIVGMAALALGLLKLLSWSISLGSGTSGGTLAPLFTIGGALGAVLGEVLAHALPLWGIDPRVAGLVGMAAIFAGASRAFLASVVLAFEATRQPLGLLPILGGCAMAHFCSCLLSHESIMTGKISRRGTRVPAEFSADFLGQVLVRDVATRDVVALGAEDRLEDVRRWIYSGAKGTNYQGFPVLDAQGKLTGVVSRRDLLDPADPPDRKVREKIRRPLAVVYEDDTLREARDHMVYQGVGRLPVVSREEPLKPVGILSRSDVLSAHRRRLDETHTAERSIRIQMADLFRRLRLP